MKKFLAMFLACVMVLSMLPVSTFAAEESDTHSHCPGKGEEHTVANCAHAIVKEEVAGYCGGYSYTWYECPECGEDFADGFVKSDATHKFDNVISEQVNATCIADGKKALVKCSLCGATDPERDGSVIPGGNAHDLEIVSAVEDGDVCKVTYGCTACDYTETKEEEHVWNTMPKILEKPGYTTTGKAQYTCVNCEKTKIVVIEANHGHDINEVFDYKAPTCTEDGNIAYYDCECGMKFPVGVAPTAENAVDTVIIPKLNHNNWVNATEKAGTYVEPTCTKDGSKVVICAVAGCGAEHTVVIPALGHEYGDQPEYRKNPTCTDYGYEVYACITCGYSEDLVMLDPLGHTWRECELHANATENIVLEDSFESYTSFPATTPVGILNAGAYYGCDDYEMSTDAHTGNKSVKLKAEQGAPSWAAGKTHSIGRLEISIPASNFEIGATYKATMWVKADRANSYVDLNIQANPWTTGKLNVQTKGNLAGTDWTLVEAVFVMPNEASLVCRFGSSQPVADANAYLLVDDIKIEKLYSPDCQACEDAKLIDDLTKTDATCTTDGSYDWTCARCDLPMNDKIPMTGHAPATKEVDARCHQYGYTFTYCTNENCTLATKSSVTVDGVDYSVLVDGEPVHLIGDIVVDKESGYDPDNHTRDNSQSVVVNKPTCTEKGNEVFFCLYCNFYDADRILPELGHDMSDYVVTDEPDCENAGEKVSTCKRNCGHTDTQPVQKLGHAWSQNQADWTVVDATCSAGGTVTMPCTRTGCNETNTVETDSALGFEPYYLDVEDALKIHAGLIASEDLTDTNDWEVLRAGDCLTIGLYTSKAKCADCNKYILVVIDGTGNGHVEPTDAEWAQMVEDQLGAGFGAFVGSAAISWTDNEGNEWTTGMPANCIDDGYTCAYVCKSCGTYVASEPIEANGEHVKKEGTIIEHQDATCTVDGHTEGWECANCDYKVVSTTITADGHNIVGIDSAELSCVQFRYAHIGCTECDYEIIKWYKDATGHNMEDGNVVINEPSCEKDGSKVTCCANDNCDYKETETIPATGHKNADGDVLVNSCLNDVEDRVCVNDNCDYANNIVPNAHKEKITTGTATCCTYAYVLHTCEVEGCDWHVLEEDKVAGYAAHKWIVDNTTDAEGYKITVKPTFHSEGIKVRVCDVCKNSESEEIAALTGLGLSLAVDNDIVSGAAIVESGKIAVTVKIDGNDVDVWGLRFSVNYNNKVLKFDNYKVVSEDFVSMNTAYDNGESVTIVTNVHNSTDKQAVDVNINAEQDLVVLYFSIISNKQEDFDDVITVTSIESLNAAAEHVETANGAIVYEISKFMDYNDDNRVNMADLMEIYNIISSGSGKYDAHLDIDKDSVINARDFVAVYKYLSGQLSYEKIAKGEID